MKTVELMVRFNVTVENDQDVDSLYLDIDTKKVRLYSNAGIKVKGKVNEYETMEATEV